MQEIKGTDFVNVYEDETKSKLIRCIPVADIGYSAINARGDDLASTLIINARICILDYFLKQGDAQITPYYEISVEPADPAYSK